MTFTTATWDQFQIITVRAVDDDVDEAAVETYSLTHTVTSSDSNYEGLTYPLSVSVTDDDGAGVAVSTGSLTVNEGTTIWEAAQAEGHLIPHLCHKPEPGYRSDGNCRACMVEIEGERVLAASCVRTPSDGMKVTTDSERAMTSRRMVIELLMADQPKMKDAHDSESDFIKWTKAMNVKTSRFPRGHRPKPDVSHSARRTVPANCLVAAFACATVCAG